MSKISIIIEVDDGDKFADLNHPMGITNEAYERLTGYPAPLAWLGEVEEVVKVNE